MQQGDISPTKHEAKHSATAIVKQKSHATYENITYIWFVNDALKGDIGPYSIQQSCIVQHSTKHYNRSEFRTDSGGKSKCGFSILMLLACAMLANRHGEMSHGYDEKACHFKLGPPGLPNPHMPSYDSNLYAKSVRDELTHHTYEKPIKEDTTLSGLRIATINVTSWSPKIQRMIVHMYSEFDILLIQEHHKRRKRDMKTGPYVLAAFAPAQKTVPTQDGRGWHTSGGWQFWSNLPCIMRKTALSHNRALIGPQSKLDCANTHKPRKTIAVTPLTSLQVIPNMVTNTMRWLHSDKFKIMWNNTHAHMCGEVIITEPQAH